MDNRELALTYIHCFCAGDIDGLAPLLAPDLTFSGTFHSFASSEAYLSSLRDDPPERGQCKIQSVTEDSTSVAVFYEYHKPEGVMQLAQLFRMSGQKISDILLVFDGRQLSG